MADHVARKRERGCAFKIVADKPTGSRPPKWPKLSCEDNVTLNLKEICGNVRSCIVTIQDRDWWKALVNSALISGFHKPYS